MLEILEIILEIKRKNIDLSPSTSIYIYKRESLHFIFLIYKLEHILRLTDFIY